MANLDRPGMVALLERLAAEDDATVLAAARSLDRMVRESGMSWDAILRADLDSAATPDDAEEPAAAAAGANATLSASETAEAARLIERLLARSSLSDTLREDLGDLKRSLADGGFEAMDLRYVRALAKRLGV
jgi:hypothetical protein